VAATDGRAVAVAPGTGGARELRTVTAAGATATVARSDGDGRGLLGFDAEAGRVVFAVAGCTAAQVHLVDAENPLRTGPVGSCPARLRRVPVRVAGRRAFVGVRCPKGCLARVELRAVGRSLGVARVASRGVRATVRVDLPRRLRAGRVTVLARFRPRSDLAYGTTSRRVARVVRR